MNKIFITFLAVIFLISCSDSLEGWDKSSMLSWKFSCKKEELKNIIISIPIDSIRFYNSIQDDSSMAYFWKRIDTINYEYRISFYQGETDTSYINLHSINFIERETSSMVNSAQEKQAINWLNKYYIENIPCTLLKEPQLK